VLITAKSVSIKGGTVLYVMRDITFKKQTEEALRKSEQKWRNILTNIPQIGISLDPRARIVFANRHFLELSGWEKEAVIGKNWFDLFIPEGVREEVQAVFHAGMIQNGTTDFSTYQNEIKTRTGELRTIAWSNVLTKDAQGEIVDVTCLGIDLTERRYAERALLKQQKLFETMFNAIPDGVMITNTQREIQMANKGMESTFGYKPEELVGRNTAMLYADPEKYREAGEMVFESMPKSREIYSLRITGTKAGGTFPPKFSAPDCLMKTTCGSAIWGLCATSPSACGQRRHCAKAKQNTAP
jgi:two-component system sensor histidine kinase/response regulator